MVAVTGGEFQMGSSRGESNDRPAHEVYVSGFFIDKYEVTVDKYRRCVEEGGCSAPKKAHDDSQSFNHGASGRRNHPINGVDWHQAKAYCVWAGKRLPTEAEWEKAARGTDGRVYPWGNEEPNCMLAVMNSSGIERSRGCGKGQTWEVGSRPDGVSPYGAYDMAGNVFEWIADWYDEDYYGSSATRDPKGPARGSGRVLRGGSWNHTGVTLLTSSRYYDAPIYASASVGFRCAKSFR